MIVGLNMHQETSAITRLQTPRVAVAKPMFERMHLFFLHSHGFKTMNYSPMPNINFQCCVQLRDGAFTPLSPTSLSLHLRIWVVVGKEKFVKLDLISCGLTERHIIDPDPVYNIPNFSIPPNETRQPTTELSQHW